MLFFKKAKLAPYIKQLLINRWHNFLLNSTSNISNKFIAENGKYLAIFAHDRNSHFVNFFGRPEKSSMDIIFDFFKKNNFINKNTDTALDIGANIGMHSILFSKYFKFVFSFEPHPLTYKLLEFNLNNYARNVKSFNFGLGLKTRVSYLNVKNNIGGAFVSLLPVKNHENFLVKIKNAKHLRFLGDYRKIKLIKVDTEGSEFEILKSLVSLINVSHPAIIFEDWETRKGKKSSSIKLLESLGYNFYVPTAIPKRTKHFIINILKVIFSEKSMALLNLDFESEHGYEIILAIHESFKPIHQS